MSWHFYDFMEPYGYSRGGEVHGPLPVKRWIKSSKDPKQHKLKYKFHYSQRASESAESYNERRAVAYARWLAQRDGVAIPDDADAQVVRSGFESAAKVHKTRNAPVFCPRIRAVEFGRSQKTYGDRSGRNSQFTAALTIEIPHWDWEPREPVEELLPC